MHASGNASRMPSKLLRRASFKMSRSMEEKVAVDNADTITARSLIIPR